MADIINGQIIEEGSDRSLTVRFHMFPIQNKKRTNAEGRPIFEDELFINIIAPGDKLAETNRPATEADKLRFPRHWLAFERAGGEGVVGTLLKEWPLITASQIREWNALGIYTVENMAGISDENVTAIMGGMAFREKAKLFLAAARNQAPLMQMQDELRQRDEQIALLQKQVAELLEVQKHGPPEGTKLAPAKNRAAA